MSFKEALAWPTLDSGERYRRKEYLREPSFSLSEEHTSKRKGFLKSCLVGSFDKCGNGVVAKSGEVSGGGKGKGVDVTGPQFPKERGRSIVVERMKEIDRKLEF
ncbi:hypothetical protein RND71_014346 [Anisodus tanguticus]|uniref:Uncharacterized protein n=1 Tax=Anisodus tanguticus TaxID=243964 RepID=A0AAE1SB30_9SOLA|nr:hypothetical protein RND71_014346 [Anisodus tanguticus]